MYTYQENSLISTVTKICKCYHLILAFSINFEWWLCACTGLNRSETHILGVVLSRLCTQLQRRRCQQRILRAELGAKEQLRITQTRVVAVSTASDGELIRPEIGQSGL